MPAPLGPAIQGLFLDNFVGTLGAEAVEYLTLLTNQISIGWQDWQTGCRFGKATVKGSGNWNGTGNGGKLSTVPKFEIPPFSFAASTAEFQKFTKAASDGIDDAFQKWAKTFKVSALPYAGSSTHTGESPGIFNATATNTPIKSASKSTYPSGISDLIKNYLTPPEFNLQSPQSRAMVFVDGLAVAIEKSFKTNWILTTMMTSNTAKGPSASSSGTGQGISLTNGRFL